MDSVKAARARMAANGPGGGAAGPGGGQQIVMSTDGAGRGAAEARVQIAFGPGGPPPGGAGPGGGMAPQVSYISPTELPDYKPPFFAGAARADGDGNIWIRTIPTRAISGGPVYDVVNRKGGLADRVQLPAGRQIVGFGPGGIVYLTMRDSSGVTLEKARAR